MSKKVPLDSDGWIIGDPALSINAPQADQIVEFSGELPADPVDPSENETAVHWNGGEPEVRDTGNPQPPEPSEAMKEIVAYYASLNQDADDPTKAGRIQLNKFLSAYPGAQGPLQSGDYEELMGSGGYFEIAVEDTDLPDFDSAMRTDLEEILRGETSYL